ncbi:hypothetical protein P691DRAFT_91019 [Macrolepiota fuliginosa MF-IS2]|uniref:Uncharacterized protein n=1 Tax=Macrolepiota fuliginosa MF-IS2 TaxID=1400762 RepID=A0A9P6C405_9AGAR|nr:hypothetical protein P691DRAFT_91019 [Macrolepiota fuliginosa MF-IS2]
MRDSGVNDELGRRTGIPETHGHRQRQQSRVGKNPNSGEEGEGNGHGTSQGRGQIWSGSGSQSSHLGVQGVASGSTSSFGLSRNWSNAGGTGTSERDNSHEGRYEQLWRQGEQTYLNCEDRNHGPQRDWSSKPDGGNKADTLSDYRGLGDTVGPGGTGHDGQGGGNFSEPDGLESRPHSSEVGISSEEPGNEEGLSRGLGQQQTPGSAPSGSWPDEGEIEARREDHWHSAFARLTGHVPKVEEGSSTSVETQRRKKGFSPFAFLRRGNSRVSRNLEDLGVRRNFLLKLAKALLYFGAPPHRIESQLIAADNILATKAG